VRWTDSPTGALDGLANSRATLEAQLPEVLRAVEQNAREQAMGQHSLFGGGASTPITPPVMPELPEKDLQSRLEDEFRVLGHYVSGHPMDPWRGLLQNVITCTMDQLDSAYADRKFARGTDAAVFLAGIVGEVRRGGDSRGFVQLRTVAASCNSVMVVGSSKSPCFPTCGCKPRRY